MRIKIVTPARRQSKSGNRATATRWQNLLREAGHRVRVVPSDDPAAANGAGADTLIALHAWRSAEAIRAFSDRHPNRPLIVAMTGTDIYQFQHTHPEITRESMARAHLLIGLHERVAEDLPSEVRAKVRTVYQSAPALPPSYAPSRSAARGFTVCVVGHLRAEKDSLRTAYAARDLPADSRLRVIHLGRAYNEDWEAAARAETERNPRFAWRGEVPHWQVRRLMARAQAMVISSVMEGGANVVSEACVAGLPVLASDIPGNRGLLGEDYPAYYPPQDTHALCRLLLRAEREPAFLEDLRRRCMERAPRFQPEAERAGLEQALAEAGRPVMT